MPGAQEMSKKFSSAKPRMAATSSPVNGDVATSRVAVFQLRISARCRPGWDTPSASSAAVAVANSLRMSRGGTRSHRVMATTPSGFSTDR
ncbi:hypothetical protein D9M72_516580 [compost metagenome]